MLRLDRTSAIISYSSSQQKVHYRWGVVYWMPYDNDLMLFGEPIIKMLTVGTEKTKVLVTIQSDYFGESKMRRRTIIDGTIEETHIMKDNSSDISTFSEYLDWVYRSFYAEYWAIIIVGHGGKLNEISPDDHGIGCQKRTWMKIDEFAEAVAAFNKKLHKKIELLYFQNCNKSTLEVIYETQECSRYTLASQFLLGAPNYYYERFLKNLENIKSGLDAGRLIIESERSDMYYSLTLVTNQYLKQIPLKFSKVIESLLYIDRKQINVLNLPIFYYADERYCDILTWLKYFSHQTALTDFSDFANFIQSNVIVIHNTNGQLDLQDYLISKNPKNFCGINLYFPEHDQEFFPYTSFKLYQEINAQRGTVTPNRKAGLLRHRSAT
ncbi:MAG: clostripain-related cysteine peptidase [Crocosphaera sp.]